MVDKLKILFDWIMGVLEEHPKSKVFSLIAIFILSVIFVVLSFTSCSYMPSITQNEVGAEGVVSKEKNINKETKWYFQPERNNET